MSALRLSAELSPERLVLFKQHRGPIKNKHACWVWRGHTCKKSGYGVFSIGRRNVRAHRMAYALAHGETPAGILVCHTCDNRPCVNPRHLFLGDHLLNARDMVAKGRQARGRGERHHSAKLTAIEVSEIRKRYAAGGISTPKLGREYGVSHQVIHRMDTGQIAAWPENVPAIDLYAKPRDGGSYRLLGPDYKVIAAIEQDYVPNRCIPGDYGDYVDLKIDATGKITNWPRDPDVGKFFGEDDE